MHVEAAQANSSLMLQLIDLNKLVLAGWDGEVMVKHVAHFRAYCHSTTMTFPIGSQWAHVIVFHVFDWLLACLLGAELD